MDLVAVRRLDHIGVRTQLRQQGRSVTHPLRERALRAWPAKPGAGAAQYRFELARMPALQLGDYRRQRGGVCAREKRIRPFRDTIECRRLPDRAVAPRAGRCDYTVTLECGYVSADGVIREAKGRGDLVNATPSAPQNRDDPASGAVSEVPFPPAHPSSCRAVRACELQSPET